MYPPSNPGDFSHVDLSALSGIAGSISIACWVVVFSPQIIENFRRSSADGLSVTFVIIWLAGDVFNILGAVLQGVLPTMVILAVYYTLADVVLLGQIWYYRGFTWRDYEDENQDQDRNGNGVGSGGKIDEERRPLLTNGSSGHANANAGSGAGHVNGSTTATVENSTSAINGFLDRRRSSSHSRRPIDGVNLSPATPFVDTWDSTSNNSSEEEETTTPTSSNSHTQKPDKKKKKKNLLQAIFLNTFAVVLVCAAGVLGWYISTRSSSSHHHHKTKPSPDPEASPSKQLHFDTLGQIFGYLCAILYLGSRIPQLLLNYRRKSTDGISLLFFLFACLGNLTYVLSIFAYDPTILCTGAHHHQQQNISNLAALHNAGKSMESAKCAPGESANIYARYIGVNASWILGSLGTLGLDFGIFVQFFMYRRDDDDSVFNSDDDEE